MRSTFWQNRISERQSSQNRHTSLKFSSRRNNSALSMKIVQNALFRSCAARFSQIAGQTSKNRYIVSNSRQNGKTVRFPWILYKTLFFRSCAARFGQIAFLSGKGLTIVTLAWHSLQKRKTVRFSWILYKTLFSGHAEHVLAKSHYWAPKFSQSSHTPEICFKTGKQRAFHENSTKRYFQVMRSTFWPNRIFERQSSENRETGLKFSSKRENSALYIKLVQNALFQVMRSTFWPNRIFESQTSKNRYTCLKFSQNGKTVRFPQKLYKTLFFTSWAARFGQIALLSVKVLKIVTLP